MYHKLNPAFLVSAPSLRTVIHYYHLPGPFSILNKQTSIYGVEI
jgi:hypothetical protein